MMFKVLNSCVTCRKLRRRTTTQQVADLPADRTDTSPPFTNVGLDVVEVLQSMDTSSFINALRRLFAIRGPVAMWNEFHSNENRVRGSTKGNGSRKYGAIRNRARM
jgi:hypothetical protein